MSSLLEQVDAAMKLFAGLERRVMEIEEIVGTRAPTAKTTKAVADKKGKARGKILNGEQGKMLREKIVAFIATAGPAGMRSKKIYRGVDVRSMQALSWHLKLLIQQGRIRKPNRVLFAVRQLPSAVMSAA